MRTDGTHHVGRMVVVDDLQDVPLSGLRRGRTSDPRERRPRDSEQERAVGDLRLHRL